MTKSLAGDTILKAYIVVITLNTSYYDGRRPEELTAYLNAARKTFPKEVFEDHLNAPCMTIFLCSSGPSAIEFLEFFPDSNKPFNSNTFMHKGKRPAFLEQLAKFMQEVENHEQ